MASAVLPGNVLAAAAGYAAPGEWEDFDDEQIRVDATKNQGDDLLEPGSYTFYKLRTQLSNKNGFEEWHRFVMGILESLNLHNLVESKIPRPALNMLQV